MAGNSCPHGNDCRGRSKLLAAKQGPGTRSSTSSFSSPRFQRQPDSEKQSSSKAPEAPPGRKEDKHRSQDAVDAAVQIVNALNTAPFLPKDQLRALVRQSLAPSVRATAIKNQHKQSKRLREAYGYTSNEDALVNLRYQQTALKFRVSSFGSEEATIVLYTQSDFRTRVLNKQTYQPEVRDNTVWYVQTVRMEWHNGHWLYVSSVGPPRGQSPQFYAKYMEDLKPYAYQKSENDG
jgi:hypothetical protein